MFESNLQPNLFHLEVTFRRHSDVLLDNRRKRVAAIKGQFV